MDRVNAAVETYNESVKGVKDDLKLKPVQVIEEEPESTPIAQAYATLRRTGTLRPKKDVSGSKTLRPSSNSTSPPTVGATDNNELPKMTSSPPRNNRPKKAGLFSKLKKGFCCCLLIWTTIRILTYSFRSETT